jgi:hypothetical protein
MEDLAIYDEPNRKVACTYIYMHTPNWNSKSFCSNLSLTKIILTVWKKIVYLVMGAQPRNFCRGLWRDIPSFIKYIFLLMNIINNEE